MFVLLVFPTLPLKSVSQGFYFGLITFVILEWSWVVKTMIL